MHDASLESNVPASSNPRGRRKRRHSNDSTDKDYQQDEDSDSSSGDDEPSFWVMGQDGPVQTPRSSGNKHKDHRSKKSVQTSSKLTICTIKCYITITCSCH